MTRRRLALVLALIAWLPAGRAALDRVSSAHPAPTPAIDITAAATPDPAFARAISNEYPTRHILRSVAIDLDRDGDLDVVAATAEETIVVWIRDDAGHLRRQRLPSASRMGSGDRVATTSAEARVAGESAASKWRSPIDLCPRIVASSLASRSIFGIASHALLALALPSHPNRGPPAHQLA